MLPGLSRSLGTPSPPGCPPQQSKAALGQAQGSLHRQTEQQHHLSIASASEATAESTPLAALPWYPTLRVHHVCTRVGVELHMGPRVTCPGVCPRCCPAAVGSRFARPLSPGQRCGGTALSSRCETAGIDLAPCSRFQPLGTAELVVTQTPREGLGKDAAGGASCRSIRKERWNRGEQKGPASGPTSPVRCWGRAVKHACPAPIRRDPLLPKTSLLRAPAFLPPSSRSRAARTCRSRSTLGFFLYMFLPDAYFAITSVRNGRDRQGGIVGAAEHQGVVLRRDKGRCVPSVTISDVGLHRGRAAFQRALLLSTGGR